MVGIRTSRIGIAVLLTLIVSFSVLPVLQIARYWAMREQQMTARSIGIRGFPSSFTSLIVSHEGNLNLHQQEVEAIFDIFDSYSTYTPNIVDRDLATMTNIVQALSVSPKYVHWVGHGYADPAGFPSLQINDQLVTPLDLYEQSFTLGTTELVYFSACYTRENTTSKPWITLASF
jgi:hypothetical protein